MPKLEFTQAEIDSYADKNYMHKYRECSEQDAKEIAVHADGCEPTELLCKQRPNEPIEVLEYRKCIWEPVTQEPICKVISSLQKIRRSPDWVIKYPEDADTNRIRKGGKLYDYCEVNFPYFRSLTNWQFALYLRKYLIDANSVVVIIPLDSLDQFEYVQPYPHIYPSCQVIEMVEDDYCVLENYAGCYYNNDKGEQQKGRSFYIITTKEIAKYNETAAGRFTVTDTPLIHNLGFLPAFKVPAILNDICEGRIYNESRIGGMICHLNEAAREYSDLQAAKVLHMYPERWEFTQNECTACKGGLQRPVNPLFTGPGCGCDPFLECQTCHGRGYVVAGPYSKILVRPVNNAEGQTNIPMPPAGYIEKDVEIIKVQEESVNAHIYKALSAVNMEFLGRVPVSQSGVAKEVDRDESRNTVHSVAEDLIAALDRIYYTIAKYRYGHLYSDEEIKAMLPSIPVPERFDFITSAQSLAELKLAKDGKANPNIINAMEVDFASKRFSTEPELRDRIMLELELDPLPNISDDDKNSRLQNDGITQETYVISCNIHDFVGMAIEEDPDFPYKDDATQRAVMQKLATEMIDSNQPIKPTIIGSAEPAIPSGNNQGDQSQLNQIQPGASGGTAVDAQGNIIGA